MGKWGGTHEAGVTLFVLVGGLLADLVGQETHGGQHLGRICTVLYTCGCEESQGGPALTLWGRLAMACPAALLAAPHAPPALWATPVHSKVNCRRAHFGAAVDQQLVGQPLPSAPRHQPPPPPPAPALSSPADILKHRANKLAHSYSH